MQMCQFSWLYTYLSRIIVTWVEKCKGIVWHKIILAFLFPVCVSGQQTNWITYCSKLSSLVYIKLLLQDFWFVTPVTLVITYICYGTYHFVPFFLGLIQATRSDALDPCTGNASEPIELKVQVHNFKESQRRLKTSKYIKLCR